MRCRPFSTLVFLMAASIGLAAPLAAQKEEKKAPAKASAPKGGAPDQEAMMKAWAEFATPADAHKNLEPFVGTWTAKVKVWMDPKGKPGESEGTSEAKWVLGGRFLEQHHQGTFMGKPFEGVGYSGYDNYKKKYNGTWMDSAGTSMMNTLGSVDKSGKVFTFRGTVDDIIAKKPQPVKAVAKVIDEDHTSYEMWGPAPDGKQFKMLDILYTRKK